MVGKTYVSRLAHLAARTSNKVFKTHTHTKGLREREIERKGERMNERQNASMPFIMPEMV